MSKRIVAVTREIQLQTDAPSPPNHRANHRARAKARAKAHSTLIGPFFAAQVHPPYPAVILTPFKCNVSCFAVVLNHKDAFCVMLYACVILVVMHQSCSFHVGGSYARAHGNNEHDTTHGLRTSRAHTHTHTHTHTHSGGQGKLLGWQRRPRHGRWPRLLLWLSLRHWKCHPEWLRLWQWGWQPQRNAGCWRYVPCPGNQHVVHGCSPCCHPLVHR